MKIKGVFAVTVILCLFVSIPAAAGPADIEELLQALQKYGLSGKNLQQADEPLQKLLKKGAGKDDLKDIIEKLGSADVKGKGMVGSLGSLSDLVESGENFKDSRGFLNGMLKDSGLRGPRLAEQIRKNAESRRKRFRKALKTARERRQDRAENIRNGMEQRRENRQKRAEDVRDAMKNRQEDRRELREELQERLEDMRKK